MKMYEVNHFLHNVYSLYTIMIHLLLLYTFNETEFLVSSARMLSFQSGPAVGWLVAIGRFAVVRLGRPTVGRLGIHVSNVSPQRASECSSRIALLVHRSSAQ